MNSRCRMLARRYLGTLRKYLADEQEAVLEQAHGLGRLAIATGLGVLDMARVHQQALETLAHQAMPPGLAPPGRAGETFFLEALSPFEAAHRGFRETNLMLRRLIETLEKRNVELARINRALGGEIRRRERTEKALRESEEHFRALFEEARRMQESLRSLSNQILHAQEAERKHISRELHDEVGQALTAISMTLAAWRGLGIRDVPDFDHRLADTQRLLQEAMEMVHRFARELRPAMLDELGLLPALRSCLHGFAERTGLRVQFQGHALAEALSADQKIVLFRVAQESLTNVAKHAEASRVALAIRQADGGISMEVRDNGKSFRPGPKHSSRARKRLGLLGMQERVRLVNGRFVVKAEPGRGTTIRVVIPLSLKPALTSSRPGRRDRNGQRDLSRPRADRERHSPGGRRAAGPAPKLCSSTATQMK